MKKSDDKWVVMNITDGILASPVTMSKTEADAFIKEFPKRFEKQGYYLTASGKRIGVDEIKLEAQLAI